MDMLSRNDLIYAAGFFDGEGCISICTTTRKISKNEIRKYYYNHITVGNTKEEIVLWFKSKFGGYVYSKYKDKNQRKNIKDNRKPFYVWVLTSINVIKFLEKVYPYLKLKKLQAEIAFKFDRVGKRVDFMEGKNNHHGYFTNIERFNKITDKRKALQNKMMVLNKRGFYAKI